MKGVGGRIIWLVATTVLLASSSAVARRKAPKKAPDDGMPGVEEVAAQARTVYAELRSNPDARVRKAVFAGLHELGEDDLVGAVELGLKDADPDLRDQAIGLALDMKKQKQLVKAAEAELLKLLESGQAEDRRRGYVLLDAHAGAKQILAWEQRMAKEGSPDARAAARVRLIKRGGATAWGVIQAGLKEAEGEREHTEAVAALAEFSDGVAAKWALPLVDDSSAQGAAARGVLARITDKKASALINKQLRKTYDKSADFPQRLRIASVLARRGQAADMQRTLLAALRFKEAWAIEMGWTGLQSVRDLATLGKLRAKLATISDEAQADAAFGWLRAWATEKAEPAVFKLLEEVARGDRRPLRLRAMALLTELKYRPAVALFEGALVEGQAEVRLAGAKGLAAVAKPGDEARVARYLRKEPEAEVKLALIEALAGIGTPEVLDSLQFVITSPQKELKVAAAKAVAASGKPKAAMLLGLLKRDADLDVRFMAWQALLRLKPRETEAEFKTAVGWLTADQVTALGEDPKIPLGLLQIVAEQGDDMQRTLAVSALSKRGEAAATKLLTLYEKSPHADTAAMALDAIATLRGAKSVATYRDALKHTHGEIRAVAYRAIGEYGPRALLETVLSGLADDDAGARAEAARAAVKLADRDA